MTSAVAIFLAGTAGIVVFSWRFSIRARRYHGVARFFAFEGVLTLLILNTRYWFERPFTAIHILSWLFLFGSLVPVALGTLLLVREGRPEGQLENTTRLVTSGLYRSIRHPLYLSIALFGLGAFLKHVTARNALLALVVATAVIVTALIEEGEMTARFGQEYRDYMKRSKRFIPGIF
jgi:protein-S-isoprenylcysteine O-methyltransferase Ste14